MTMGIYVGKNLSTTSLYLVALQMQKCIWGKCIALFFTGNFGGLL